LVRGVKLRDRWSCPFLGTSPQVFTKMQRRHPATRILCPPLLYPSTGNSHVRSCSLPRFPPSVSVFLLRRRGEFFQEGAPACFSSWSRASSGWFGWLPVSRSTKGFSSPFKEVLSFPGDDIFSTFPRNLPSFPATPSFLSDLVEMIAGSFLPRIPAGRVAPYFLGCSLWQASGGPLAGMKRQNRRGISARH